MQFTIATLVAIFTVSHPLVLAVVATPQFDQTNDRVCIGSVCMKPHLRSSYDEASGILSTITPQQMCGVCQHGNCNGTKCICNFGWTGPNCSVALDCSSVGGCGNHGICVIGGKCECELRWSGANCSVGSCPHNCSSHGQCDTSRGECICDHLWIGRACQRRACISNCTGMGECVDGVCSCLEGYSDSSKSPIEEDCSSCLNLCSGHGDCDRAARRCLCSPWYTGDDCSTAICPDGCSGHGSCGHDGACVCDAGWTSYACDVATCVGDCSGHGTCAEGECVCQPGYGGPDCASLPPSPGAPPAACLDSDGVVCSGHGSCQALGGAAAANGTGTCVCDPGWAAPACAWRISCEGNCSGHGACIPAVISAAQSTAETASSANGTCQCNMGWAGQDCSVAAAAAAAAASVACPSAPHIVGGLAVACAGRGACVDGQCVCDFGFEGPDCSVAAAAASGSCNTTCLGASSDPVPPPSLLACSSSSEVRLSYRHFFCCPCSAIRFSSLSPPGHRLPMLIFLILFSLPLPPSPALIAALQTKHPATRPRPRPRPRAAAPPPEPRNAPPTAAAPGPAAPTAAACATLGGRALPATSSSSRSTTRRAPARATAPAAGCARRAATAAPPSAPVTPDGPARTAACCWSPRGAARARQTAAAGEGGSSEWDLGAF